MRAFTVTVREIDLESKRVVGAVMRQVAAETITEAITQVTEEIARQEEHAPRYEIVAASLTVEG